MPTVARPVLEDLTCNICPHDCLISPDSAGRCGVIQNRYPKLVNARTGHCSNISVEPIEKRPFFHVLPGSKFLSVGFYGCSLFCLHCQNYRVSQQPTGDSKFYSPSDLVQLALERNVRGIAFTYNEPTLYHDYIEEVGHEIGRIQSRLKLVIKTSGFANLWVIRNLSLYADAINVDIKGNDDDYKACGGWVGPVMKSIEWIISMGVHLEISYLVLPGKVHDYRFNVYLRDWLADLNSNIPVHLLYFYPFHRMIIPSYKPSELLSLRKLMLKKLSYVYISNHFETEISTTRDTICRKCGNTIVSRQKGSVISNACCDGLPGVFENS